MIKKTFYTIILFSFGFIVGHLARADYHFLKGMCPFAQARIKSDEQDRLIIKAINEKIEILIKESNK